MNMLVTVSRTLMGLFVDDGSLAVAILIVVLVSGVFSILMPDMPLFAGRILLVGMPCRAFSQCHESRTGVVSRMAALGRQRRGIPHRSPP
jgi:hypothetical protein